MSKIICEICGTTYSDTEPRCPICGWSQDGIDFGDELAAADEQALQEEAPIPAPREPVKKQRNKEIFDYDAVNTPDFSTQDPELYDDEELEEEGDEHRSNPVLVVFLTIVIVVLLGTIGFILFRYFLPARTQQNETKPTESMQISETTEETIPTVPCTGLSLTSGMPTLSQEGQFWLLHVVVMPEDTTDVLTYVSLDESVVSVNEEGRVTALAEGETTIIVSCGSQRIECPVTVDFSVAEETTEPVPEDTQVPEETEAIPETQTVSDTPDQTAAAVDPSIVLKLKKSDITIGRKGVYVDLELDCALTVEQVEWSTANPNVATVKNGAVTAVGPGITTITVKYGDQTATCIVRCSF